MSDDRPRESRPDPSASTVPANEVSGSKQVAARAAKRAGTSCPATARTDPSVETPETNQSAVLCPYCEGTDTEREHPKGPSLCRSIYFCHDCGEPFEAMA